MPGEFNYTSADIIQRLISRYNLQGYPIEPAQTMIIGRTVIPVTNTDDLLREAKNVTVTKDLTPAAGTYVPYHVVPNGKRWIWRRGFRDVSIGATDVLIKRARTATAMPWSTTATAAVPIETDQVVLNQGDSIGMATSGNGGDGAVYLWVDYEEEDAF